MAITTDDGTAVQGGAALPVYLKNLAALVAAIAAGPATTTRQVEGVLAQNVAFPAGGRPVVVGFIDGNGNVVPLGLTGTLEVPVQARLATSAGASLLTSSTGGSADGATTTGTLLVNTNYNRLFNGASWDRERSNANLTILPSAARTTTTNSADQTNHNGNRLTLVVNVSVVGTGSITPSLQIKDSISGNYATVWTAAAPITTATTATYYFADGASGGSFTEVRAAGLSARDWRVVMTHNNANSITYSASAVVLV
jgi:hypothetical protein